MKKKNLYKIVSGQIEVLQIGHHVQMKKSMYKKKKREEKRPIEAGKSRKIGLLTHMRIRTGRSSSWRRRRRTPSACSISGGVGVESPSPRAGMLCKSVIISLSSLAT